METKNTMYHVSFNEPVNGKKDYYFSSLSAIYTKLSPEEIGCKVTRLWNLQLTADNPYVGKKCKIAVEVFYKKNR